MWNSREHVTGWTGIWYGWHYVFFCESKMTTVGYIFTILREFHIRKLSKQNLKNPVRLNVTCNIIRGMGRQRADNAFRNTIQEYYTGILFRNTIQEYYSGILFRNTIQEYYSGILFRNTIQEYYSEILYCCSILLNLVVVIHTTNVLSI